MKKYVVIFSGISPVNNKIFSSKKKAKDFIIGQFKKFLDKGKNSWGRLWENVAKNYEENFDKDGGIEDFAYLFEIEEDNTEDINWDEY